MSYKQPRCSKAVTADKSTVFDFIFFTITSFKPTLSKTLNASLISSSLSVSFIFLAIIVRNSGKSMVPLPWGGNSKRWMLVQIKPIYPHFYELYPTISIHLIDHVLEFGFSWVLTQRPHDCAQLLGGNGTISIFIEQGEGLLELWNRNTGWIKQNKNTDRKTDYSCYISATYQQSALLLVGRPKNKWTKEYFQTKWSLMFKQNWGFSFL